MTEKKTIIFDLGGVLIDWNPKYLYRQIFDEEHETEWFLENICTMSWNEEQDSGRTWADATAMKVLEHPQYAEPIKAYASRWSEMLGGPIQKSVAIFKTIKESQKYQVVALTNWSAETFPIAIERYDFLSWFDGIVVSGTEKTRKPFPDIYKILLSRYDVNPGDAVFIDDNIHNVQTGLRLGIDSIHFKSPADLQTELTKRNIL